MTSTVRDRATGRYREIAPRTGRVPITVINSTTLCGPHRYMAEQAKAMLLAQFPTAVYEIHPLTPAFITQGGPGCVAVQVIKEL